MRLRWQSWNWYNLGTGFCGFESIGICKVYINGNSYTANLQRGIPKRQTTRVERGKRGYVFPMALSRDCPGYKFDKIRLKAINGD